MIAEGTRLKLDHVIYGTADLDVATARIEAELGLEVLPGGRHVGQGSHNRIVPLGPGYLELLAIADRAEAEASPIGRLLLDRLSDDDGLIAWAVSGVDVPAVAERLGTPLHSVSRDGMTAHVTGVEAALTESFLPFFVGSDSPRHPGDARHRGRADLDRGRRRRDAAARVARRRRAAGAGRRRRARACAPSASASGRSAAEPECGM